MSQFRFIVFLIGCAVIGYGLGYLIGVICLYI